MAAVQAENVGALSCLWMIWTAVIGSGWVHITTNRHGVTFNFSTVFCFDEMVIGPNHARGGTPDLLKTDVPDLVRVAVVSPFGNSDHWSQLAGISMAQDIPNFCVRRIFFLKHRVNLNTVCGAIRDLTWWNIWIVNENIWSCPCKFYALYQLRSSECVTTTSLGLMMTEGMRSTSSSRFIFGELVIALE